MCDSRLSRRALLGLLPFAATGASASEPAGWVEPDVHRRPSSNGEKRVALTLDACPGGVDQRILDVLINENVRATIFLTARWIAANPAGMESLLDHRDLFAFENHGARHIPPILGDGTMYGMRVAGTLTNIRREIEDGAAAIKAATGASPTWYRGAAARYSPEAIAMLEQMNLRAAGYSLSADQGASLSAASVAQRMAQAKDGEVILGHINQPRKPSGEGLARGIVALKQRGFSFVHLDGLSGDPVRL